MYIILHGKPYAHCGEFHIYGNEDNDSHICKYNDLRLPLNLQFFADDGEGGEKTEPATQKKLDDARKEGQVAKSREIANGVGLLALFLVMKLWSGPLGIRFLQSFDAVYNRIPEVAKLTGGVIPDREMAILFRTEALQIIIMLAPVLIVGVLIAFLCDYIQVGWKPTPNPLKPKFSKLDPTKGFKKILSPQSLVELIKSIAKIFLIGYITYSYIKGKDHLLFGLIDMPIMQAIRLIGDTVTNLGMRIAAVYLIISAGDYIYQKFKFNKDMKMTKQEVKEEYKNQEGNPEIKGKIRQRMREASQRRMMQAVPQADVVITNPTHYAVAIKYDSEVAPAPVVLAKGADYLALRIKKLAGENDVYIVEDKPLARMLYANVEVGAMVPPELYQAVAEVLAFVYHAEGKV
ncbi:MAG: flagellar biosynthesis protein FlhB [Lachnospiraceae bacterium]|nr:flagellar biosynthesis protein FlhB [Lachnospiraceae bacterium]